jgi:ribose 5-phosphate isomerase B
MKREFPTKPKLVGIAADHGGYELKEYLAGRLREAGHEVIDFGDRKPNEDDDYPDFIVPLARAVSCGDVNRGVGICGSGVGASVAANKVGWSSSLPDPRELFGASRRRR